MEHRGVLSAKNHHGQMSESFLTAGLLSLSGGLQDAYTYLARGEVFANAQTGNIVLMSVRLFEGAWAQALRYLVPLTAFFLGVLAAELLHLRYKKMERFHWRQLVLLGEIVLLAAVGFFPGSWNLLANSAVSFACAMQVQAFRKVDGYAFASTMCIGNLRSGTESLCAWWKYGAQKGRAVLRRHRPVRPGRWRGRRAAALSGPWHHLDLLRTADGGLCGHVRAGRAITKKHPRSSCSGDAFFFTVRCGPCGIPPGP